MYICDSFEGLLNEYIYKNTFKQNNICSRCLKSKDYMCVCLCVFVADITGSALVQGGGPAADLRADRLTRSALRRMIVLDHGTVSETEERDHAAGTAADHVPETERGRGHTRSYTAPSFLVFSLVMYYNISVLPLSRRSRSRDRRRSRSRDRRRSKSRSRGRRSTSDTTMQHIQNHQLFF